MISVLFQNKIWIFFTISFLIRSSAAFQRHSEKLFNNRVPFNRWFEYPKNIIDNKLFISGGETSLKGLILDKASLYFSRFPQSPQSVLQMLLLSLSGLVVTNQIYSSRLFSSKKPIATKSRSQSNISKEYNQLKFRYLIVFWLLKFSDWLQGPYFYAIFKEKMKKNFPGSPYSASLLMILGFLATGLFGPFMGYFVDRIGRKSGSLLFCLLYILSSLSLFSNRFIVLLLGRIAGGMGTSLLFSAPESWLVGEYSRSSTLTQEALSNILAQAYSGDSLIAIMSGLVSSKIASIYGPIGPFLFSILPLSLAFIGISLYWNENSHIKEKNLAVGVDALDTKESVNIVRQSLHSINSDPNIRSLGFIQALFEGSMYLFVLIWPELLSASAKASFGQTQLAPFGLAFSCLMASCLVGNQIFSMLHGIDSPRPSLLNQRFSFMLALAAVILYMLSFLPSHQFLATLLCMFGFEIVVGFYFPSISTLRARHFPPPFRSILVNLFGIPLNILVVLAYVFVQFNNKPEPSSPVGNQQPLLRIMSGSIFGAFLLSQSLIRKEKENKLNQ